MPDYCPLVQTDHVVPPLMPLAITDDVAVNTWGQVFVQTCFRFSQGHCYSEPQDPRLEDHTLAQVPQERTVGLWLYHVCPVSSLNEFPCALSPLGQPKCLKSLLMRWVLRGSQSTHTTRLFNPGPRKDGYRVGAPTG